MNVNRDTFSNLVYGTDHGTSSNNCYAWAIGHYKDTGNPHKLQPGELSGTSGGPLTCKNLERQAMADAKATGHVFTKASRVHQRCGNGQYKIMLFLDPDNDYHWYRQHRNVLYNVKTPMTAKELAKKFKVSVNDVHVPRETRHGVVPKGLVLIRNAWTWSHKRGLSNEGPILVDAGGNVIFDPKKANRAYDGLNYTVHCGTYCRSKKPVVKKTMTSRTATRSSIARETTTR